MCDGQSNIESYFLVGICVNITRSVMNKYFYIRLCQLCNIYLLIINALFGHGFTDNIPCKRNEFQKEEKFLASLPKQERTGPLPEGAQYQLEKFYLT